MKLFSLLLFAIIASYAYAASAVGVCLATQVSDNADKIEKMTGVYASKPVLDKAMQDMKANLDVQLQAMQKRYDDFKKGLDRKIAKKAMKTDLPDVSKLAAGGVQYIMWGKRGCPATSKIIYTGWVGGAHYSHRGSGSEYLCLPDVPKWGYYNNGSQNAGLLYVSEMETAGYGLGSDYKNMNNKEPACCVCMVNRRDKVLMIPGRRSCYDGWTLEYKGYLMAAHYSHNHATSWICMYEKPETHVNSNSGNQQGSLMYPTELNGGCYSSHPGCGACPSPRVPNKGRGAKGEDLQAGGKITDCQRYVNDRELTCSVCTK